MAGRIEKILARFGYQKAANLEQILRQQIDEILALAAAAPGAGMVPPAGRSSVEEPADVFGRVQLFQSQITGLDPYVPADMVEFLTRAAIVNPDLNHATTNLVNLANNGHTLMVESESDQVLAQTHARLNEKASTLYWQGAGIDGLINDYIQQIAHTGAISSEDVVAEKLDGVDKVVIVPAEKIRFQYLNGEYVPFQKVESPAAAVSSQWDMVELNPITYSYMAFRRVQNSPYAIPLYFAAIEPILTQRDMYENVKFIMRKLGLILATFKLRAPRDFPGKIAAEKKFDKTRYLEEVLESLKRNFSRGLMVHYDDQEFQHHDIAGSFASGSEAVWNLNEQQIASGMGLDPNVIGRNYSSTESYANVVYMFMIRQANNIRRLPKRRMERTYNLDLLLAGIPAQVKLNFQDNPSRDPLSEAQAEQTRVHTIIKKVETGAIDPNVAAQELGYDEWYDIDRIGAGSNEGIAGLARRQTRSAPRLLRWRMELQRYDFIRPSLGELNLRPPAALASEKAVQQALGEFAAKYEKALAPFFAAAREEALEVIAGFLRRKKPADFRSPEHFADEIMGLLAGVYLDKFSEQNARATIRDQIGKIYEHYRVEDTSAFPGAAEFDFTMDARDRRTLRFMERLDRFYLSKFVTNEQEEAGMRKFLIENFVEKNAGLFGRGDRAVLDEFRRLAGEKLINYTDTNVRRIVDTAVSRMRNWAHIKQLDEAKIKEAEYFNKSPEAPICKFLTTPPNNVIKIGDASAAVDKLSQLKPEAFEDKLKRTTLEFVQYNGVDEAVKQGLALPPLHPHCHTRLIARR